MIPIEHLYRLQPLEQIYIFQSVDVVYDLRAQNLRFVAPMPEQIGTTTLHFPEVSGGTYQKEKCEHADFETRCSRSVQQDCLVKGVDG